MGGPVSARPVWRRHRLLAISWDEVGRMIDSLATDIRATGYEPTVIVGIARGGLAPAVALSNRLGVLDFRILSIPRNSSNSRYSERADAVLDYMVPDRSMAGADVLIVDDIMGDGGTMTLAAKTVRDLGARTVRSAVLVRNVGATFGADHEVVQVDDWTVFPWEEPSGGGETATPLAVPR
jgi:hypoxanthine phosphoribosyltransferase